MIDLQLLRNDPDRVKRSQRARGADESIVDRAVAADVERRTAIAEFEALRAEQNVLGKLVAAASKEERPALVEKASTLAAHVKAASAKASEAEEQFTTIALAIDNIVLDGVPEGGEANFEVLRTVGEIPSFSFEPLDHLEIAERLGDRLDTRVRVSLGAKKGQIVIEFATVQDLNRILGELNDPGFSG